VHPIIVPTDNPILLALMWGIVATWWVGLFLGIPLAFVCRFGSRPKLTVKDVVRPVLLLLVCLYGASMLLGLVGYTAGRMESLRLLLQLDFLHGYFGIGPERYAPFLFNLLAHEAAYWLGAIGGIVLLCCLWKKRHAASLK
jgi:hypothetical protein